MIGINIKGRCVCKEIYKLIELIGLTDVYLHFGDYKKKYTRKAGVWERVGAHVDGPAPEGWLDLGLSSSDTKEDMDFEM